ncbi:hypothetical protein EB234_18980 [Mesorhizobium japonicum R7A]|nr:hypothetical protein EB234_18980 [Mesorhizobium japonicum R7A]
MTEHKLQSGDRRNVRRLLRTSRLWVGGTHPQIPEADMRRPKPRRPGKPQHPAPSPPRTELAKAAGLGRKAAPAKKGPVKRKAKIVPPLARKP